MIRLLLTVLVVVLAVGAFLWPGWLRPAPAIPAPTAAPTATPTDTPTDTPTATATATVEPTTAATAVIKPIEAFCQLGVTQLTDGVATHSLAWDPVQLRGYMDDSLSSAIWVNTAYCRTEFPSPVTLLFDSVAGNPIRVDGRLVPSGNGRIETGSVFEWVYKTPSRSNGHAYIVQRP